MHHGGKNDGLIDFFLTVQGISQRYALQNPAGSIKHNQFDHICGLEVYGKSFQYMLRLSFVFNTL